jgi:MoaA/NifB/PqqE/SkfB family radical SAM enzyme
VKQKPYGLAGMIFRSIFSRVPPYLIFFVTSRCDSRCVTCFNWKNLNAAKTEEELSLDEIERIAGSCKPSVFLSLSGGEPFLREDIAQLCGAFSRLAGTMMISIPTNCLRPESIAERTEMIMRECGRTLIQIELSLDGLGETHDRIRGVPGNFEKVMETYRLLSGVQARNAGLRLKVCSVLNRHNRTQIRDLLRFVSDEMKVDDHSIVPVHGNPRDESVRGESLRDYAEVAELADSLRYRDTGGLRARVFREVQAMARESILKTLQGELHGFRCPAGSRIAVIGETGLVYRCETAMEGPVGDLRSSGYDLIRVLGKSGAGKNSCSCGWSCAHLASVLFTHRGRAALAWRLMKSLPGVS